jgi:hypothetical protein
MILLFQVGLLDANGDLTGFRDQNLRQNSKFRGQFILTMPCNRLTEQKLLHGKHCLQTGDDHRPII